MLFSQSVAYAVRHRNLIEKIGANGVLTLRGGSLFVTKTVGEFLYEGYDDPLIDVNHQNL